MASVTIQRYPAADISALPDDIPVVLRQILARRGIKAPSQLDLSTRGLPHFNTLKHVQRAAERIATALNEQQRICICGDFDADGATSTALMVSVLQAMGAQHIGYIVPNRFADGYGLSPSVVEQARQQGAELIITVDSGISCHAGVQAATAAGIDVVITDHHLAGAELPAAFAIVNPNQPDCQFPGKSIAGVGVAFYVLLALRQHLRDAGQATPNLADWLDLVALGTVADVVKLDGVNRILVQQGLQRIRAGHCRPGIQALLEVAGRDPASLQAADLGFAVAPRINAAGRLDDMGAGIECLLTTDLEQARMMAQQLDQLNKDRRHIETEMREEAEVYVSGLTDDAEQLPPILVLHQSGWHQGVVGIVAGRVKEQCHRPVIAFAEAEPGWLKGSARSIPGLHIRDLLERVHTLHPQLVERFGGHAMAAGLTLRSELLTEFRTAVTAIAESWLEPEQLTRTLWSDGELDAGGFTEPFVRQIESYGPWGQGFSEPLFDGEFTVVSQRLVGERHLKLVLQGPQRVTVDAIAFNIDTTVWPDPRVRQIHALYKPQLNHFRGRTSVQLQLEHFTALR
ncbi:ssDNA exonuclease RecJ [Pseudidiomarina salinarum]|uniref:Single-stranded-DNA-specific exonuclease RecJ n=1 Tax=Pseudidiomarina salinarum TaxID=435908 RepID=A0A094LA37_9GAMM|nr:single-stranded-DNA-specific exonuclease RecJ [Pseudidiomarina salinarum]KFZ31723.1 ssDNA exonuclease RecJ [Pseudidiomarina salinarum]RUO70506.1 single-stranded-DNA-specific exonuclease RecJ [Pseudidiomarina salinarum]